MRVLVVLSSLYTGGAEYSTLLFYKWLRSKGHEIRLLCYKSAHPQYDAKDFDFPEETILQGRFIGKVKATRKIIREFKPEIIHSVLVEANVLTRCVSLFERNPVYLESLVNEMYSPFRLQDARVKAWKLKLYQYFDAITVYAGVDHFHANGQSVALHYRNKLKISARKITVIPRGRNANTLINDVSVREKVRTALGISSDTVMFLNIGRQEFQKGHDFLVPAVAQLAKQKLKFIVVIAGREGNFTSTLDQHIRELGVQDYFKLIGHRSDVQELLAAADVFIFPSRFEGLPGSLIEASAAALPIIASDIPNNREVAEEGRNALYFSLEDPSALPIIMTRMITNKDLRHQMGAHSKQIFEASFSLEEVHEKMEHLLTSLLPKSATRPAE